MAIQFKIDRLLMKKNVICMKRIPMKITIKVLIFVLSFIVGLHLSNGQGHICLNEQEQTLFKEINAYRVAHKLKPIVLSHALTKVAKEHVKDLNTNYERNQQCNPHSWSNKGEWKGCCYTNTHKNPHCMWDKPREIAGYDSEGYEIVYWHSHEATAQEALEGWKRSSSHNPVIINKSIWRKVNWKAIGIAVEGNYASVWFGQIMDQTPQLQCEQGDEAYSKHTR